MDRLKFISTTDMSLAVRPRHVCRSCIAVMDLTFPIFTRILTKDLIPNRELRMIVILTCDDCTLPGEAGFPVYRQLLGHVAGVRMEYRMRKDLFSHLQTLDVKFFDNTKVGYLMSRIVNDLREVSELAHHGPEDLFIAALMLIGSFAYLSTINLQLTVIVFLFVPVIGWFAMSYRKRMYDAFKRERESIAEVNADLENSLSGMRETKSFTNEEMRCADSTSPTTCSNCQGGGNEAHGRDLRT